MQHGIGFEDPARLHVHQVHQAAARNRGLLLLDLLRAHRVSHAGTMRIDQGGGVGNQHFGGRGLHLQFQTDLARHGRPDLDQRRRASEAGVLHGQPVHAEGKVLEGEASGVIRFELASGLGCSAHQGSRGGQRQARRVAYREPQLAGIDLSPHNPHASRINPIRIPVLSSYQSRGKTRYPVEYVNSTDEAQAEDIAKTESPMQAETVRLAVIVPAYRPEESLLQLIGALSEKSIPAIVLVDDGSGPDYRETFRRAEEFPKVRLVRHAINLGKGAALKTGINYALCAFPGLQGVVTADADGQHHPDDIEQVADRLAAEPDRVVLGTRTFSGGVPLRSRVGNVVTRTVMRALVGQNVSDTQTGLRGIPARLLPRLLRLEANGYDFELDMLITVRQQAIRIAEVPIRTIYEPGNRTSHFNPLIDSMKIYFVLLRFSSVSLATAALDTLVFYLASRRLGNLAASQALGRLLAVAFNY